MVSASTATIFFFSIKVSFNYNLSALKIDLITLKTASDSLCLRADILPGVLLATNSTGRLSPFLLFFSPSLFALGPPALSSESLRKHNSLWHLEHAFSLAPRAHQSERYLELLHTGVFAASD